MDEEDHKYAVAFGRLLSRTIGGRAAFYLQPSYIVHANACSTARCLERIEHGHDVPGCLNATTVGIGSNTLPVGWSTRLRLTAGLEKRLRGHVFQLNVSNSFF